MSFGFDDMTPEGKRYFRELEELVKLEVVVGFQNGQNYEDGVSLAEVAAWNEFGDSKVPARPFMRQSFENHEKELQEACDNVNKQLIAGGNARQALEQVGVFLKGLVQTEIVEGGFAPNSPSTIAMKGSDRPLIDSGYMRQSVNYLVRESTES